MPISPQASRGAGIPHRLLGMFRVLSPEGPSASQGPSLFGLSPPSVLGISGASQAAESCLVLLAGEGQGSRVISLVFYFPVFSFWNSYLSYAGFKKLKEFQAQGT